MHKPIPITIYDCTCQWCKHPWRTKTDKLPKVCPKCSRTTWDGDQPKTVAELVEEATAKAPIKTLVETFAEEAEEAKLLEVTSVAIPVVEILGHEADPDQPLGDQIGQALNEMPKADKLALLKRVARGEQVPELELPISEPDLSTVEEEPEQEEWHATPDNPFATPPMGKLTLEQIVLDNEPTVVTEGLDQTKHW